MQTEPQQSGNGRRPCRLARVVWLVVLPLVLRFEQPAVAADDASLVPQAEAFVEDLRAGELDRCVAKFDATMREKLPADQLRAVWSGLQLQQGTFAGRRGTRVELIPPYRIALVTCEFARGWLDARIVFNPAGEIAGLFFVPARRPDEQVPPYVQTNRFEELPVTFGDPGWPLPGTLALPREGRPAPAAILVHGSGPNDRDETVGANRPFRDLAWGLASRGVAVLRYDKRTKAHQARLIARPDSIRTVREEVTEDVAHAFNWLRDQPAVDTNRIVLVGHSLGGMLAPRIARETPGWAAIAVLAGPAQSLAPLMVQQTEYLAALSGPGAPEAQALLPVVRRQAERVAALTPADAQDPVLLLGAPASYWLDLAPYHAPAVAAELDLPVWVLHGARDYQVPAAELAPWRAALTNRPLARIREYPDLNHLFIAGAGRSQPAEYQVPGFVSAEVVTDLATWINDLPPRPSRPRAVRPQPGE